MPETCEICHKDYANVDAYNIHLNRRSHYRKMIQYECLYSQFPESIKYHDWKQLRADCDRPRKSKK